MPGADLSIRELGIPNLDKSSQAEQKPSASTKNEKGAFPFKRGTFKNTEGRFLEISLTKIEKSNVFGVRTHFLKNVVFQCPYFTGGQKLQIENHEFYHGRDDILVGQGARTP